jgi:hypothetical protein
MKLLIPKSQSYTLKCTICDIYVCVCVYIYTHTHTHTHTYIHYTFLQDLLLLVVQLHPLALPSLPLLSQDLQTDHQETVKVLDLLIFLH